MTEAADALPMPVIEGLIADRKHQPGALLPILHAVQDAMGHIPAEAVAPIAQALNVSRAEVHGVISFYHHFRTRPPAPVQVQLCRAEACQSMGADALWRHACERLGVSEPAAEHGARTADGRVSLQPVYCLGLCSCSPAMMIDGQVHGRVQAQDFDRLVGGAA